jgi:alanyl-tRNA synthetase
MKNIKELYKQHCLEYNIEFQDQELTVKPYNDSTLFCPAGIQQFNHLINTGFKGTFANIQPCIRLNDLEEIGDGSHLLYFNMIGLFSFRELTLQQAIDFWMSFISNKLELKLSKITIHPDKPE